MKPVLDTEITKTPLEDQSAHYHSMGVVETLDAAVWTWRRDPSLFAILSLLGLTPPLALILGLQYMATRRLFATSYDYDYVVFLAAVLMPLALGWRALHQVAMIRGAARILQHPQDAALELKPRVLLTESLERSLSVGVAGLWRACSTWLIPIPLVVLALTVDPELDEAIRIMVVVSLVMLLVPMWLLGSALSLGSLPRAAMTKPGQGAPPGSSFFKNLGLGFLWATITLALYFNLHLGQQLMLFLADALFDVDVSYWGQFCSLDNPFYTCLLLALTLVVLEPIFAMSSFFLWVDGRVRKDSMDLRGRLEALAHQTRRRNLQHKSRSSKGASLFVLLVLGSWSLWGAVDLCAQELSEPVMGELVGEIVDAVVVVEEEPALNSFEEEILQAQHLLMEEGDWGNYRELNTFAEEREAQAQTVYQGLFWAQVQADVDMIYGGPNNRAQSVERLRRRLWGVKRGVDDEVEFRVSPEEISSTLEEILAGDEFEDLALSEVDRNNPRGLLDLERKNRDREFKEAERKNPCCEPSGGGFGRSLNKKSGVELPNFSPPTTAFKVIAVVLLLVALLLIVLAVVRRLRQAPQDHNDEDQPHIEELEAQIPGEEDALAFSVHDWRSRAMRLAQEGDKRLALRALYLALLVGLHRRGLISYDEARTNGEIELGLRSLWAGRTDAEDVLNAFSELTLRFDLVWYGRRGLSDEDFQRCLAWADQVLALADRTTPTFEEEDA